MDPVQPEHIQLNPINLDDDRTPEQHVQIAEPAEKGDDRQHHVQHVGVDFFDPSGVNELRRTLSQMSGAKGQDGQSVLRHRGNDSGLSDSTSELTLTTGDGPFDFEKTLKSVMRR